MCLELSEREISMIRILEQLKRQEISQIQGAQRLGLSTRQVRRNLKKYHKHGVSGLSHGNRGRSSPRKMPLETSDKIIFLLEEKYSDYGPTFISEKLKEFDGIKVSREWLRTFMISNGFWKKRHKRRKYRQRRERRHQFGELVQGDGSRHRWFVGDSNYYTIFALIDDATSRVLSLRFIDGEAVLPIMNATQDYFQQYGRPHAMYFDKGGVYRVNNNNENGDRKTSYEIALNILDVEVIHAHSPQAKGRVERLFKTLQDRLVKEMHLRGITTIEKANQFIEETYLPRHNARFAKQPINQIDAHRPILGCNLERTFVLRDIRTVQNDWTISFKTNIYQIDKKQRIRPRDKVEIHTTLAGKTIMYRGKREIKCNKVERRPDPIQKKKVFVPKPLLTPANHQWRNGAWFPVKQRI